MLSLVHKSRNGKFRQNHKRPQIGKTILTKKNKAGVITFPDFKLCYKATITLKNRHKNQWSRIESPEIKQGIQDQLIFDKEAKYTPR